MKKIAFALQVLTLIAMLPLYVIIEMNHESNSTTQNTAVATVSGNMNVTPEAHPIIKGYKMKI